MLVVQGLVLQLEVLKFFVLSVAVALEGIGQVVDSFANLLVQLLELRLGNLLKLLYLHLEFTLLLPLGFQGLLEMVDSHLHRAGFT